MSKKPEPAGKKQAQAAPAAANAKAQQRRRVPLLLEAAFSLTRMALLTCGPLVLVLSLQAGATPLMAAMRAGAALLVLGLLLWSANWVLARSALEVIHMQLQEAARRQAPSATIELEA